MPAKVAKRIWLYGLVPQSLWVVEEMWKPNSAREGEVYLTVEEDTPEAIRMRVHGSVLLTGPGILHEWPERKFIKNIENRYDARLEGAIEYDRTNQQITRFDLTALGDFSGRWFGGPKGWNLATPEAPLALAFAFEIDRSAYARSSTLTSSRNANSSTGNPTAGSTTGRSTSRNRNNGSAIHSGSLFCVATRLPTGQDTSDRLKCLPPSYFQLSLTRL
jgi:hypothetical protein